jgi:type I restriction enzyme S subunit
LDIILNTSEGVSTTRSLIFNLATSGKLEPQTFSDPQPENLLELVGESGVSQSDVPGWLTVNLGLCGDIYNGNSTSASEKVALGKNASGLNYIATKDVGYGFQPITYETGIKVAPGYKNFKIAPSNSLLICLEGGSAGKKMGILEQEVCFGNKLFAVVCKTWIEPKYLLMYFLSSNFQKDFSAQMSGIIGGISKAKLLTLPIPVPPVKEQRRIIERVERLIGICDELESSQMHLDAISRKYARSVIAASAE